MLAKEAGDITVIALNRAAADLRDPKACVQAITDHAGAVDVVINAAAYTAVDKAEVEPDTAKVINSDSPSYMARACATANLPFLHISTDYVFNGQGTQPWRVGDATGPLGVYGRTKLDGEHGVVAAGGDYAVLRTSWVFSAHGANFVKTMLRLAETRDALTVVGDQIGGPTPARDIADALLKMARAFHAKTGSSGIYHLAGAPYVSWADFAREIFEQADSAVAVTDIPTSEYPTPAARPLNSRLDCSALTDAFNIRSPDWRIGLSHVLTTLAKQDP